MVHTRNVDGIHRPRSEANKYTAEELLVMETQDIGYVLQKLQSEKKKVERLSLALHVLNEQLKTSTSILQKKEAKEIKARAADQGKRLPRFECITDNIKRSFRKTELSYKELHERKERVRKLF